MSDYRKQKTELVIALSFALGTDISNIIELIKQQLKRFGYRANMVKVSKQLLIPLTDKAAQNSLPDYERKALLMDKGNELRENSGRNDILAGGIAGIIADIRRKNSLKGGDFGNAYIIDSLKHPDEADTLREIYPEGFYLFAISESEEMRIKNITAKNSIPDSKARSLVKRDSGESTRHGQHTRDVFDFADFHLSVNPKGGKDTAPRQVKRIMELIFSNPFITPDFDEYAMFMAYSSALRSADLSRQAGAVITKEGEIIATGANEVPCPGGGQYWPGHENLSDDFRDFHLGYDSNKKSIQEIAARISDILGFEKEDKKEWAVSTLLESGVLRLTEFGRPVHAEMSAIMACARLGISLNRSTLYCTTFPCHNCAKHIISAGISKVIYIEPYPKSKTLELYSDSISIGSVDDKKVSFLEFTGIGPRRFYDLFSLRLGRGRRIYRKDEMGNAVKWSEANALPRCPMPVSSYIEREEIESRAWKDFFV